MHGQDEPCGTGDTPIVGSGIHFVDPPWSAPFDASAALRGIPETATVAGLFLEQLADAARRDGKSLPSARERYLPFRFYPLREHASLLLEASARMYGNVPIRQALRKLGRAAPKALLTSTLGKVVLASAAGPEEVISAMVRAYPINVRPCRLSVLDVGRGRAIVRVEELSFFLDSHHIGAFEGALTYAGKRGAVKICAYSPVAADLLCTWEP